MWVIVNETTNCYFIGMDADIAVMYNDKSRAIKYTDIETAKLRIATSQLLNCNPVELMDKAEAHQLKCELTQINKLLTEIKAQLDELKSLHGVGIIDIKELNYVQTNRP